VGERVRGFGAVVAGACLKALAGLLLVTAALAAILALMQLWRDEPARQVAVLAFLCGAGGIGSWWLGGAFARIAKSG
jgi:predicted benzoate:H+ symporter BenE